MAEDEEKMYLALRGRREKIVRPLVAWLAKKRITPDSLSYTGLAMLVPFVYFFSFHPWIAFVFLLFTKLFDSLDGSLARYLKRDSRRGAFLDVSCDYVAFFTTFLVFFYFKLFNPFWGALYILNYAVLEGFVIYGRVSRLTLFPVFNRVIPNYGCYLVFFIWLISGYNYFDPFLVFVSIYMAVTNFFLFLRVRWSL